MADNDNRTSDLQPMSFTRSASAHGQELDPEIASSYVGKYILVGITYLDSAEQPTHKRQVHGEIEVVTNDNGIVIRLSDGSYFSLPPDLEMLQAADPGSYRLRETGETVENPDFVCFIRITPPPS